LRHSKKSRHLRQVNSPLLAQLLQAEPVEVVVERVEAAAMDERWSLVGHKKHPRWLWPAINHATGRGWADVRAPHTDAALESLMQRLKPFGMEQFYTDGWGGYTRILDDEQHEVGKHYTQKIERKHLTLRTRIKRLARKTICFSKSEWLHDIVIRLFVNRYEFGLVV
jgi:IS1 family transposase